MGTQVNDLDDFLAFLEAAGETIRPGKIEFYTDGSHKVTAWNIGKSIDELYNEKTEEIEKVVGLFKQRCYGKLNDEGLGALAVDLKKIIRLFKDEGHVVFKDNPDYQKRIKRQFDKAVKRLEGFLNDVVIPTIEYRSSKGGLIGDENNKEFSGKVPHLHLNKDIDHNINKETENCSNQNNLTLSKITNNFDNLNIKEVFEHFKEGLVAKKYLTEQELLKYLKAAFDLETVPENLFKIKDAPTKGKIYEAFYRYYKNVAGKPHGKQKKYAALLGNYFEGYNTATVSSNFSKAVY